MKGIKASFGILPWPKTNGGPDVMLQRFIASARNRRYTVVPDWRINSKQPCLLNLGHRSQNDLFAGERRVVYRVAGMFLRDYFERMAEVYKDRIFKPEFERSNKNIGNALRQADFVIYQSYWSKRNLDNLYERSKDTWAVLPNAVDLRHFAPPTEWPRQRPKVPVIGAVGSLRYRSRLEILFDVAKRLTIKPQLLLIGNMDSYCQETLMKALSNPFWKNNITHIKSVPPEMLPQYYQKMDCLVHTVAGDSCPNVVVEALACGVPVVCPEDGGTKELVDDAGFSVVDPEGICGESMRDGMAKAVMQVFEQLPHYQQRARQRAENNNNLEILTSQYLSALGFPPYAYEKGWKYKAARLLGNVGSGIVPRISIAKHHRPQIALILWDWNVGGMASWMFRLAQGLPEYDFHFLGTHLEEHSPVAEMVGRFAHTPTFWRLVKYLREQKIDLVQISNNRWPADAARAAGVRHIIERTDGTRSCCSVSKSDLDYVIVSAAGTLPFIQSFWPDVSAKVIYNAVDLNKIDTLTPQRTAPSGRVSVGRCSRFGRGKRLDLLIEAISDLKEHGLPVHLTLVGEDSHLSGAVPVYQELQKQASALSESVTFYGRTDEPLALTKGFDIGVCCSDPFNEGIPNSLIEPMACGKPVVATDIDQVSELVEDGVSGILVPPGNAKALAEALELLVVDSQLRAKMGKAARMKIENIFSFFVAIEKYKRIYKSLLPDE